MLDRERSILGQAIIKSLLQSPACPQEDAGGIGAQKGWIDAMFPYLVAKIEAYAKLDTPLNALGASRSDVHLSDEQVASGIAREAQQPTQTRYNAPNGKTYAFASEKQGKRAYAIQKSMGWDDYQVRMLCQKYGFQSTKKIPVGVYEAFCNELQRGPQQTPGSAHLESSDQPPF